MQMLSSSFVVFFFFFKQKTAYEMRISDWSSDVCSSDLTPLLLVALGELVCEKTGVLNLGQEGMMLFGAVIGFIVAFASGNLWLGVLFACLAGVLLSLLFAMVALGFNANQVATGLALTIFGVGMSSFVGASWVGKPLAGFEDRKSTRLNSSH